MLCLQAQSSQPLDTCSLKGKAWSRPPFSFRHSEILVHSVGGDIHSRECILGHSAAGSVWGGPLSCLAPVNSRAAWDLSNQLLFPSWKRKHSGGFRDVEQFLLLSLFLLTAYELAGCLVFWKGRERRGAGSVQPWWGWRREWVKWLEPSQLKEKATKGVRLPAAQKHGLGDLRLSSN